MVENQCVYVFEFHVVVVEQVEDEGGCCDFSALDKHGSVQVDFNRQPLGSVFKHMQERSQLEIVVQAKTLLYVDQILLGVENTLKLFLECH